MPPSDLGKLALSPSPMPQSPCTLECLSLSGSSLAASTGLNQQYCPCREAQASSPLLPIPKMTRCPRSFWTLVHSLLFLGSQRLSHYKSADNTLILSDVTLTYVDSGKPQHSEPVTVHYLILAFSHAHKLEFSLICAFTHVASVPQLLRVAVVAIVPFILCC